MESDNRNTKASDSNLLPARAASAGGSVSTPVRATCERQTRLLLAPGGTAAPRPRGCAPAFPRPPQPRGRRLTPGAARRGSSALGGTRAQPGGPRGARPRAPELI